MPGFQYGAGQWGAGNYAPRPPRRPTDVQAFVDSATEATVSWTDTEPDELGVRVLRDRLDPSDESVWSTKTVADLPADSESASVAVQPDRTYQFRVEPYRWHDGVPSQPSNSVETPGVGLPASRTRRSPWTLEIVTSDGSVLRPDVLEEPSFRPGLTVADGSPTLPRAELPVPKTQRYLHDGVLEAECRLWYHGQQLPVSVVTDVGETEATGVIEVEGGRELTQYVDDLQADREDTHEFIEETLQDLVPYRVEVDDPDANTRTDVPFESITRGEWFELTSLETTDPFYIEPGKGLTVARTFHFQDSGDFDGSHTNVVFSGETADALVDGTAARIISQGDSIAVSTQGRPDYDMLGQDARLAVLWSTEMPSAFDDDYEYNLYVNGSLVSSGVARSPSETSSDETDVYWEVFDPSDYWSADEVVDGSITVEWELDSAWPEADGQEDPSVAHVTAAGIYDNSVWDASDFESYESITNEQVNGPPATKPQSFETDEIESVLSVVAGELDVGIDDTSRGQALAVSNDGGDTWEEDANTGQYSTEFSDPGESLMGRVTLDAYGAGSEHVAANQQLQTIEYANLYADLDDTPVLVDQQYRGELLDALGEMLDSGHFLMEITRDPTAEWDDPAGLQVTVSQAGQRERDAVPEDLVSYETVRSVEDRYDRVVVFGSSYDVEGESFVSDFEYGNAVGLEEEWLLPASETVYEVDGEGEETVYERGEDYEMDWKEGTITVLADGEMATDTEYEIEYRWRVRGEAVLPDAPAEPRTLEERVPDATTGVQCEQLAWGVLRRVQQPLVEAEVTVTLSDPTLRFIEALDHPRLPGESNIIRDVAFGDDTVTYTLGSRRSVRDIMDELSGQIWSLSNRV